MDRAVRFARSIPALHRFTWMTRILLAMAFLPTGAVKMLNRRFTTISVEDPIGLFFETLYQTTDLWIFIGAMQMLAAVFLLIPGMRTLGAIMFFPIILSILLVTHSLQFGNTVIIVSLMLLAVTYLIIWDYSRIKTAVRAICGSPKAPEYNLHADRPIRITGLERAGWIGVTVMGLLTFAELRSLVPFIPRRVILALDAITILVLAAGLVVAVFSAWKHRSRFPERGRASTTMAQ